MEDINALIDRVQAMEGKVASQNIQLEAAQDLNDLLKIILIALFVFTVLALALVWRVLWEKDITPEPTVNPRNPHVPKDLQP